MTEPPIVAFLGPRGTYSEEAVEEIMQRLGIASFVEEPQPSIFDALKVVEREEADRAVVPFENSLEGSVTATLDGLAVDTEGLEIIATHEVPIDHCLIAASEIELDSISTVLSHPQATGQCAAYLRENLPGAEVQGVASTAEAVRLVSERGGNLAALGSKKAAEIYDCAILEDGIGSDSVNVTRFGLIARTSEGCRIDGAERGTSIVFSELGESRPGALTDALGVFSSREINLTRIQSHPIRGELGRYMFFIDLEGSIETDEIRAAVDDLDRMAESMRVLGSYSII